MLRTAIAAACTAAAAIIALVASPAEAQAPRLEVGTLRCSLSSSIGLVVGSQRNVSCIFSSDFAPDEAYEGRMTRIGLDIGVTTGGRIIWSVFATTNRYAGMLSGRYVGATAEASVAVGLGANVLVGGSRRSVALQPVSVQGQTGFNIAAGVGELRLRLAEPPVLPGPPGPPR
ncbi:MAG: DUF992 domain-containing protein [Xanthobacteraceae bacterium]